MKKTIKLIYIGERLYGNGLLSCFIEEGKSDREENIKVFKRRPGYYIGTKYKAETNGDSLTLFTSGRLDEEVENETLLKKWRMESLAATSRARKEASRKKIDKNPLPEHIIKQLQDHMEGLNDNDKTHFIDYLVNEIVFKPMSMKINQRLMNMKIGKAIRKKTKKRP